jgi:integrase/recombinase XerD
MPPACFGIEVVSKLLGHASLTTTVNTYAHISSDDARRALADAGWFASRTVTI